MSFFRHASRASDTVPLRALIEESGAAGYGNFWLLMEFLWPLDNTALDTTAEDQITKLCDWMRMTRQQSSDFIAALIRHRLLRVNGNFVWNEYHRNSRLRYLQNSEAKNGATESNH